MSVDVTKAKSPPAMRTRTRIWAALISLFVPGLGQAFLGHYRRGVMFTIAIVVAVLIVKSSVFLWPAWPQTVLPVILLAVTAGVTIVSWAAIDSWRLGRRAAVPRPTWPKRYLVYLAPFLALFAADSLGLGAPQWRAFRAPSASMLPTLQAGDHFFVLVGYFDTHEPQRGDVVVFKLPCHYPQLDRAAAALFTARCDNTTDFIKRLIGLPADKIQMKGGILNVNGQPAKRERLQPYYYSEDGRRSTYTQYIETLTNGFQDNILEIDDKQPLDDTDEFIVPPNTYFMIGDNRDDSADSRDPTSGVGFVPRDRLVGKAALVYFSIAERSSSGRDTSMFPTIRWDRIGMPLS